MDSSVEVMDETSSTKLQRANNDDKEIRQWSDMPDELLAKIASTLGPIELLGFRSVCKNWNSASHSASIQLSSQFKKPSLLIYGENSDQQFLLLSNSGDIKKYRTNIPELSGGATCIASGGGWLLMMKQDFSICFFRPFSHAKIDLPKLPDLELLNYVAAFSSEPTSQDCVVSFICQKDESPTDLILYVLRRGESVWTSYQYTYPNASLRKIVGGGYYEDKFYFLDGTDNLVTFSAKKIKWKNYNIIPYIPDPKIKLMPFLTRRHYLTQKRKKQWGLEDVSVTTCGTVYAGKRKDKFIFSESIDVPQGSETPRLKGAWVHPRFFDAPHNCSW